MIEISMKNNYYGDQRPPGFIEESLLSLKACSQLTIISTSSRSSDGKLYFFWATNDKTLQEPQSQLLETSYTKA